MCETVREAIKDEIKKILVFSMWNVVHAFKT